MKTFRAERNHQFVEQDFIDAPVWATYYEPDDIEALVDLGFDRSEVCRAVLRTGTNDEYSFPLPAEAAEFPFNYLHLGVRATINGGMELVGYLTGPSLCVFYAGAHFQFNAAAREHSRLATEALACALGVDTIFPMQLQVIATGERKVVAFW